MAEKIVLSTINDNDSKDNLLSFLRSYDFDTNWEVCKWHSRYFKDIETIIFSKPLEGYQNFSNLLDLTNITAFKLTEDYLVFEPKYIQILYKVKYEDTFFNLLSIITLESRDNNIIRRSISA